MFHPIYSQFQNKNRKENERMINEFLANGGNIQKVTLNKSSLKNKSSNNSSTKSQNPRIILNLSSD